MKFDDDENKFPKFAMYLVYDFGKLVSNKAIVNGMKKWGKMSSDVDYPRIRTEDNNSG